MNTEVCEQLFSWLSKFSAITKHMNRWRFLFLMIYVLDNHNEDVVSGVFHWKKCIYISPFSPVAIIRSRYKWEVVKTRGKWKDKEKCVGVRVLMGLNIGVMNRQKLLRFWRFCKLCKIHWKATLSTLFIYFLPLLCFLSVMM